MYVEILASGEDEEAVRGVVEDELDDMFGAENYTTHDIVPADEGLIKALLRDEKIENEGV